MITMKVKKMCLVKQKLECIFFHFGIGLIIVVIVNEKIESESEYYLLSILVRLRLTLLSHDEFTNTVFNP